MFKIFGRKKDEEEQEEEKLVKPVGQRTPAKRKEPPKPWGRKERLLVGAILFFSVATSATLAMYARSWKLPNLPRLNIDSINLLQGEKIVLEGNGASKSSKALLRSESVVNIFKEETAKLSGVWGLYVYDIKNDFSFGVNENEEFQAASLIKLPLIVQMYALAESGEIALGDIHTLTASDKVGGAGTLYSKPNGTEVSYEELIKLMANLSDNSAFRIGVNIVGEDSFTDYIKEIGMIQTSYAENVSSPVDIGRFFKKLYSEKLVNPVHTQKVFEYLTKTAYENHLAKGIPEDIVVAHKYGAELHVVNDAGVVFASDPFIIVIMTKGVVEAEANEAFPTISKLILEEFR